MLYKSFLMKERDARRNTDLAFAEYIGANIRRAIIYLHIIHVSITQTWSQTFPSARIIFCYIKIIDGYMYIIYNGIHTQESITNDIHLVSNYQQRSNLQILNNYRNFIIVK